MAATGPATPTGQIPLPPVQHFIDIGSTLVVRDYDWGNYPQAWFVLGLHNQSQAPTQAQYEDYCRRFLANLRDLVARRVRSERTMWRRYTLTLMAIKTISGHARMHIDHSRPKADFPDANDLPPGLDWGAQMARIPAAQQPPLAANIIAALRGNTRDLRDQRGQRKRTYSQTQGTLPSINERKYNRAITRKNEWEFANRYSEGLTVTDDSGRVFNVQVVPTYKETGNSLWHALSYQINGNGRAADCRRSGLRGGRREKAWLYHYFTHVLHNPTHIRHRVYTWLQSYDKATPNREGYDNINKAWGECSILRCLATNSVDSGLAKAPMFKGIMQLISDFWGMEVIVFEADRTLGSWNQKYDWWVFGSPNSTATPRFRQPLSGNGQLFFVTDPRWAHFDIVKFDFGDGGAGFDTSGCGWLERYGHFGMEFLNTAAGGEKLDDRITWNNGLARDDPGFVEFQRPADHPMFRLLDNDPLVVCFDNDRDVVETRPGYGDGKMPILPTRATIDAWTTQRPQPGDQRPTTFEPWLITSGYYRPVVGADRRLRQGKFVSEKGRVFEDTQQYLRAQGIDIDPAAREVVRHQLGDGEQLV